MMDTNWFEKFEEYLYGEMNSKEKLLFETALSSDAELSSAFRVYRTIETEMRNNEKYNTQESALKESLQILNSRYFETEPQQSAKIIKLNPNQFYKTVVAVAASIVLILAAYFVIFHNSQNTQRLADNYFKENLKQISQTMDASTDSLQLGIAAYNNQEYKMALQYFQGVYRNHPTNSDAKKNIGLVYLATEDYAKALQQFDELANIKGMYSNPGLFLKALTLMRRNQEGDERKAKHLLQQVVNKKAEGSEEAAKWLEKF